MGIKNFPVRAGPCSSLHCPPSPPLLEKYIFFALPSLNVPLPAELNFRENTEFVTFRYVSNTMSKWWEMMKIHQAKTKFKTEWEGSYPVKRILSDPFSCLCLPYTWFQFFPMPLINPQVSPQISRVFYLDLQVLWSFGVERSARGPLFSEAHIKRTPCIILREQMGHFV